MPRSESGLAVVVKCPSALKLALAALFGILPFGLACVSLAHSGEPKLTCAQHALQTVDPRSEQRDSVAERLSKIIDSGPQNEILVEKLDRGVVIGASQRFT